MARFEADRSVRLTYSDTSFGADTSAQAHHERNPPFTLSLSKGEGS
jgi:hypothetical protein